VPVWTFCKVVARASQPTIRAISWIRALTSRALVVGERSWESFALTQGWVEMWAFGGNDDMVTEVRVRVQVLVLELELEGWGVDVEEGHGSWSKERRAIRRMNP